MPDAIRQPNSKAVINWQQIAERASREPSRKRLVQLVRALCDRLEQIDQRTEGQSMVPPERANTLSPLRKAS